MDVASLAGLATGLKQVELNNAVQVAVFKKALDLESQGVLQLLQAATQTMASVTSNPPHLGNTIDSYA